MKIIRILKTQQKAKDLRPIVEKLVTLAKINKKNLHS